MKSNNYIPQFVPYWDDQEKKAVEKVLNGDYLNEHKKVREFEREFARYVGARYCITCTSGTIALYLAIKSLLNKKTINSIVVPDYAGIFVANAATQAGIKSSLIDVKKDGTLDATSKNQFVIHTNGRIGHSKILEDCAQAINHHTKNCISCYSFSSTKHITTGGQGGAICCDDHDTFELLSRLKDHGRKERQKLKTVSDNFEHWGTNFKFTEIQAAFGLVQLKKLPIRLKRLSKMYQIIREELDGMKQIEFFDSEPRWYIDMLVAEPARLIKKLHKARIQARRFYKPLHLQQLYHKANKISHNFKNTEKLYGTGIWLPSTTNLTDEELKLIINSIKKNLKYI